MAQAPQYERETDFSEDELNNAGGRSTVRTAMLDAELDLIATSVNALQANQELNQRDDGEIRDERVKLHTLSAAVRALIAANGGLPRGEWVTATAYALRDVVKGPDGNTYISASAHTSGVFADDLAAQDWVLLSLGTSIGAGTIPFTPTATIAATDIQAAINESDTEIRALLSAEIATRASEDTTEATARATADTLIRTNLADTASASNGSGMVGFYDPLAPTFLKTTSDILNGLPVSILRFINKTEWADIRAGTSTTDVSSNFTTAVSATRRIDLETGKYRLNSSVTLRQDVQWRGFDKQNTILEFVGAAGLVATSSGAGAYDICLSGFYIKGDNSGASRHGLYIDGTAANFGRVDLENLVISNFSGDGLRLYRPIVTTLKNVQSSLNGGHGFDIIGDGTSVNALTCYASTNTGDGWRIENNLQYSSLIACASDGNTGCGYNLNGTIALPAEGISLINCGAEANTDDQFKATGAFGLTLQGIFQFSATGHFINLDGCRNVALLGVRMDTTAPVGKYALNIGNMSGTQFPSNIKAVGCSLSSVNDAYRSYVDMDDSPSALTFKSGTTGSISNGATVTHDLGVTPTQVLVSTGDSTLICDADSFTSTQFRLLVQDNAGGFPAARAYRWTVIA